MGVITAAVVVSVVGLLGSVLLAFLGRLVLPDEMSEAEMPEEYLPGEKRAPEDEETSAAEQMKEIFTEGQKHDELGISQSLTAE